MRAPATAPTVRRFGCFWLEPLRVFGCPFEGEQEGILGKLRMRLAAPLRHDVESHPEEEKRRPSIDRIGADRATSRSHSLLKVVERGIEHVRRESLYER